MTKVKYLSIALIAAAALASPAMARGVASRHAADAYASSAQFVGYGEPRGCVPAPRVGAFATAPWTSPPCEPYAAY